MANWTDFMNTVSGLGTQVADSIGGMMNVDPQSAGIMAIEQEELETFGKPMTQEETVDYMSPDGESLQWLTKPGIEYGSGNFGFDTDEDTAAAYAEYPDQLREVEELATTTGVDGDSSLGAFAKAGKDFVGGMGAPEKQFKGVVDNDPNVPSHIGMPQIEDKEQVAWMQDQVLQRDAKKLGEVAKTYGKQTLENGNKTQLQELYTMVKDASKQVGNAFDLTYEAWDGLAPSTKLAMIGTAATAFAYNKGWKKTAGDVALTSANMYSGMYSKEQDVKAAGATAQGKRDAKDLELRAKNAKPTYTEGDRKNISSQVENIVTQSGEFDSWIPFMSDPEKKAQYIAALTDEYLTYTGGVQENMVAVPLLKYLQLKKQKEEASK